MTKVAMVCNWDSNYQDIEDIIVPNRRWYAHINGYPLYESHHDGHWGKIPALLSVWDKAEYLWWLDFDAVITSTRRIDSLLFEKIVVTCDHHGLNSGSMIIPTIPEVRSIFEEALSQREYFSWDNRWFDQNAIGFLFWRINHLVHVVRQSVFNSYPPECQGGDVWEEGDLVLHCPGIPLHVKREIFERHGY